jgi:hypothetical protein
MNVRGSQSAAGGTRHSDRHQRACFDLRPVNCELQPGKGSGRKPTLDFGNGCRIGRGGIGQFVNEGRCARCMSDEQHDLGIIWKVAYRVKQGVAASVVEEVGNFHAVPFEPIELQQLKCRRARAALEHSTVSIGTSCSRK